MIKSLTGLSFRFFRNNKFIAISSVLSVAISISLILTMTLFISNAKQSLTEEVQQVYGTMDLAVGYDADQEKMMDAGLLERLNSFDEIEQSSAVLKTQLYIEQMEEAVQSIGVENDLLAQSRYHFSEAPGENEVILNSRLAEVLNMQNGDALILENRSYTVKEITADSEADGDMLVMAKERIRQIEFEKTGVDQEASQVLLETKEDVDLDELAGSLKSLDADLRIDIAQEDEIMGGNLDLLNQFVTVLSVLVLLLTSLFIISNFEVFLYKYKNQLAIMRALGASTSQLFKVIFIQSGLITILGAVTAFVLALATRQFVQNAAGPLFGVSVTQTDFNFKLALIVIVVSAVLIQIFMLIPAYRSSKILPLVVMQENEAIDYPYQELNRYAGWGLLAVSPIFILLGALFTHLVGMVLLGALFVVIALFLLLPIYITSFLLWLLPLIKSVFGNISYLTVKNLIPQVRKNILVVFIIGGMMMIAVFGSAFLETIRSSDELYVRQSHPTEILLSDSSFTEQLTINQKELKTAVEALPAIENVSTHSRFQSGYVMHEGQQDEIIYAYADLAAMAEQGIIPSSGETEWPPMIMQQKFAETYGFEVGSVVEASLFYGSSFGNFTIAAIVEELPYWGEMLVDWNSAADSQPLQMAFIEAENDQQALNQLTELKRQFPGLTVSGFEQAIEQSRQMFLQRWSIFIIVLAVILFSVMLGVVNTLINNIYSRRKEYAVLRAISLSKKGIIQVIMTQITVYLSIGLLFGIGAGALLTFIISLVDTGTKLRFDFGLIAVIAAIMVAIVLLVFIPFANKLAGRPISGELTEDNK